MYLALKLYLIYLNSLSNQSQNCSDNQQFWSENVRCPTTISGTVVEYIYLESFATQFMCEKFHLISVLTIKSY